jgi:branched-chain amino acid transport system ATP-binding protein
LLSLRGVTKTFGRLQALDGIDLDVYEGEAVGVIGPNGAGKSTLFNVITRLPFGADGGEIEWCGSPLPATPRRICRSGIARTFQRETTFETLTVGETVRVCATYGGQFGRREFSKRVDRTLDLCRLRSLRDAVSENISLLDKRRLMLASALVTEPKLLLLDEPVAGLSQSEQAEFISLMADIRQSGTTLLVIEHILPVLMQIVERVIVIAAGRKLVEAAPEEVMRHPEVVEAYLGKKAAA